MKTALVYDRVNKWGGAERVLLVLHEMFPDAPLYTSVYDPRKAPWAKVFPKVYTSFLQKFPFAKEKHELFGWLMPLAFESFNFDEYDLVVSITTEAAKGIITKPQTKHVCYCLTPTRYLWSGYKDYFTNPIIRLISEPIVRHLRNWDKVAAQRPDVIIAISTAVKERIRKYYGRKAEVIFPPVTIKTSGRKKPFAGGYFLVVSRFVPYKKVDLAIETFNRLGLPLVIAGTGSSEDSLRRKAGKNVKFTGLISEKALADLYEGARALVMPQEEDFGLVAVEAQKFGVPVIAFAKGGVLDSVVEGKTGLFFHSQNPQSLGDCVKKFDKWHFDEEELILHAGKFSKGEFRKAFIRACLGRRGRNQTLAEIERKNP